MIDVQQKTIEQYILENSKYDFKGRYSDGIIESSVIDHFSIDAKVVFNEDDMWTLTEELYLQHKA